jgi:D-alanyl-D-alanine carboxypeptidase/D-alanyl-D-alanine-endopeptidase (penicillin-binding protein 4)
MRSSLFILLLVLISVNLMAHRPLKKRKHNVNKTLKEIVTEPNFKTAGFGFLAIDVNSGEIIAEHNPDLALRPASNLKLLTTATAIEILKPGFRFKTVLEYSGTIDTVTNILHGNLIIRGGGDPTLGSKYFNQTKSKQYQYHWKRAINQLDIDSITGSVIADASYFSRDILPPSWSWQNMGNYYGAGACGLTINDNMYKVCFNTGNQIGLGVKMKGVFPTIPGIEFDNSVLADSIAYDDSYIFGAPYCNKRYIRGALPVGKNHFCVKGSMPDPALVAAWQLDSLLRLANVGVAGSPSTMRLLQNNIENVSLATTPFDTIYSPTLSEIILKTNTYSINLFAEHCGIAAGMALGANPEIVIAMDSVKSYWRNQGMDTRGMSVNDGSGQSQYNVITARQLIFVLDYMKEKSAFFDDYYNSLAVGGKTGTLKHMFGNSFAKGNVHAKSGTIDGVKSYSGYVTTRSGREVAFSVMVNNFSCSSKEARAKLEQLMIALAEFDK